MVLGMAMLLLLLLLLLLVVFTRITTPAIS
jgi:hypothetical protein